MHQEASLGTQWKRVALGNVLTLINGRAYGQDELLDSGTPVIRIQNLNGGDNWYYSNLSLPDNKYCENGDLLFAWSATFGPYVWKGCKAIYHYHIWKVIPSPELDKRFAYYLLQSITDRVKSSGRGISMIHMTKSAMEAWEVDIPPLDEQRRIAAILDKADALRRKRKRALDLAENARDSLIESALKTTSNGNLKPLGECLEFMTTGGRNWSQYYSEDGSRFIRSLDVQMNSISNEDTVYVTAPENAEAKRTRTHEGDVLLTVTGSRIGRVAELPASLSGSYVSQHVAILRLDSSKLRPKFLSFFLSSREGQRQIQKWQYGQTKPGLNFRQIESFLIPGINIDMQIGLEKTIIQFEALVGLQKSYDEQLSDLFSSLQHRAFSGQL